MSKIAFLGLGVMGFPMAGHLSTKFEVTVYNRTASKAEKWINQYTGNLAMTPAEAAKNADFVFSCVGNDDDLRSILLGIDGAIDSMKEGTVFTDHTTCSAKVTKQMVAYSQKKGIGFVDAPVSGGQAGAENGQLTIMCGGAQEHYDRIKPVISQYAKFSSLIGPSGSGQLTKMVNQICIAGLLQALSEGLKFSEKANLDGKKVLDVISKGAAGSWQMENRGMTMLEDKFNFGFAVDWMKKDLNICLEEANINNAKLPVTALVNQFYTDVQDIGGGRLDTSSLIKRLS